jgi:hypothetical protein
VQALAAIARSDGIESFTVSIHGENRSSAALFRALGAKLRWVDGASEGRFVLPDWPGDEEIVVALRSLQSTAPAQAADARQSGGHVPATGGKPRAA